MAEGLGREERPSHGLIYFKENVIDRLTFGFHSPSHAAALVCERAFSYPDFPALAAILERERCRANKKAGQPFAEATGQRFGVGPKALLDAPQAWRCRANTKRHGREIAHRAIEGAQAPPGLDACGIARRRPRVLPLWAFAAASARMRTCGATRKPSVPLSRHERASPPPRGSVGVDAAPCAGPQRVRNESLRRRATHCDMAKSRLREKPRSLFVPRRKALQAFVSAPRAAFVPVGASGPEGAAGRDGGAASRRA